MLNNRKKTFESLENLLQRYADKIVLYLAVPRQEGLIAEDEIDWLTEAAHTSIRVLNNLEAYEDSRYVHKQAGIFISCDIDDKFALDVEFGHSDNGEPIYIVTIEAIYDWDDDMEDMDLHWRILTRRACDEALYNTPSRGDNQ